MDLTTLLIILIVLLVISFGLDFILIWLKYKVNKLKDEKENKEPITINISYPEKEGVFYKAADIREAQKDSSILEGKKRISEVPIETPKKKVNDWRDVKITDSNG